ncbi:MAG: hypothetical protein Q8R60_10110 [Mycobacteriales bacterium]|nr:hypothetical protein [Mycobacteriales bacterium]
MRPSTPTRCGGEALRRTVGAPDRPGSTRYGHDGARLSEAWVVLADDPGPQTSG